MQGYSQFYYRIVVLKFLSSADTELVHGNGFAFGQSRLHASPEQDHAQKCQTD